MNLYHDIQQAVHRLAPYVIHTPWEKSLMLSEQVQANVYFKNEHCQKTGSFKIRGAFNKILSLPEAIAKKGVVCASAGNHGIGVAVACQMKQLPATVFLPKQVDAARLHSIEQLGACIQKVNGDCGLAEREAIQYAKQKGLTYISPYNDPVVIAGQGTIGYEMAQDCQALDYCFVSVGGGGLISGIGTYLKEHFPQLKLIGCLPENSSVMADSVLKGAIVPDKKIPTLSDSTAGDVDTETITLALCEKLVDDFVLVSESEIKQAMQLLARQEHYIVEGAAAVALAAMCKMSSRLKSQNVGVVLCGRNIEMSTFLDVMQERA